MTRGLEPAIEPLAAAVGLTALSSICAPGLLWASEYARLMVVQLTGALDLEEARRAEDWLLQHIRSAERETGRLLDGYLVVALPQAPEGEFAATLRDEERDRRGCRKFVVWPEGEEAWAGLERVTVLGLPGGGGLAAPAAPPSLPSFADRLLQWDEKGTMAEVKAQLAFEVDQVVAEAADAPR